MIPLRPAHATVAVLAAGLLAACGGDSGTDTTAADGEVTSPTATPT
ncbi:hypothetical protein [Janibacter indicus]